MSPNLPPVAAPTPESACAAPPGLLALFVAFARMSLAGFGGVLVWVRRSIVETHGWMTPEAFNDTFALCHFLPGPNIVNLSVVFGARFRGVPGALAALAGLLGPSVAVMTMLAALYARYGEIDALRRTLEGVSCAAIGLLLAVIARMMLPLLKAREPVPLLLLVSVFVTVGLLRWPLATVLLISIPVSIGLTIWARRRAAA